MTHSLTNRLLLPALLRNTTGIDTPAKNSLCWAAAGITKAFRATAGGLIPHIKLREVTRIDAPNAKSRPFAQPVVGCKHPQKAVQRHSNCTYAVAADKEATHAN